jgi:hypothetical protein
VGPGPRVRGWAAAFGEEEETHYRRQSGAPFRPLARPRVAHGFRGRPLARPTVGSPDSPVHTGQSGEF